MTEASSTTVVNHPAAPPVRLRSTRTGLLSGLVGGICCLGSALALATGLGALSFFQMWMDRYQVYFVLASVSLMVLATVWIGRRVGLRGARRMLVRHAAVMVVVYAVTFGTATMVYGFIAR
jgi:hypothetical protein